MLAAILIRGTIHARPEVRETLKRLNLVRKNSLVLLEDTPVNRGMLKRVESYTTYGPISDALAKEIVEKRGVPQKDPIARKPHQNVGKHLPAKEFFGKRVKPAFRLAPPLGGFEREGIKKPQALGGVLGERSEMDGLVRRMLR